jgi:tRNA nucleotidyltransferase (CCA-adding enzyme)
MIRDIPKEIIEIYNKVKNADHEIYFVGGCVRDLFLKNLIKDWDFATSAKPEEILKIFPDGFYDNKFGTVGIPIEINKEQQVVEITTYRTEREYKDHRHPTIIEWGKSIEEDLARRDFTINAIAMDLVLDDKESPLSFIDPYNGRTDVENKLIKAVGNPEERFTEDALRLMRAIRFSTQLSFKIEDKTWEEIKNNSNLITKIAAERISDEFFKILASNFPHEGVVLLKESGLLNFIIPELLEGENVSQVRPGRHHTDDVLTHNLMSLKHCPSKDPIVRFAALIHDAAKPKVRGEDENGLVIFHNHEIVGAKVARDICERLKFSKKDRSRVVNLIRWHMFTVDEHITDAAVRRFIRRVGVENVKDIVDLRIGDRLGGGTQTAESWRLKLFKKRVEDQLKPKPFSIEDMAIDGNDVMKELSIKPSRKVGEILKKLFAEVDEDLSKNTREYLLEKIKELNK